MRILVLAQGRRLDGATAGLCDEYARRAQPMLPFERVPCPTQTQLWQRARAQPGVIVVLDERGAQVSTAELATRIQNWRLRGTRRLCFLVGGADGFSPEERQDADWVLSLSALTLPHRLAQVLLCEQLYRVGTIATGHPYHHG